MFLKIKILLLFILIISCQPVEIISPIEINTSKLEKISINAKNIFINNKYNSVFSKENIEDKTKNPPITIIQNWMNGNIDSFGNQNKFKINILEASIFKTEIENDNKKKYAEKTIFLYEIYFLVEYELFDDNDFLLANATVETSRSTTSKKYISLNEGEMIINILLNDALKDFTKESKSMINLYMSEYIK